MPRSAHRDPRYPSRIESRHRWTRRWRQHQGQHGQEAYVWVRGGYCHPWTPSARPSSTTVPCGLTDWLAGRLAGWLAGATHVNISHQPACLADMGLLLVAKANLLATRRPIGSPLVPPSTPYRAVRRIYLPTARPGPGTSMVVEVDGNLPAPAPATAGGGCSGTSMATWSTVPSRILPCCVREASGARWDDEGREPMRWGRPGLVVNDGMGRFPLPSRHPPAPRQVVFTSRMMYTHGHNYSHPRVSMYSILTCLRLVPPGGGCLPPPPPRP